MKLRLYHGSENIIEVPEYGKGMRNNDYGRGFYCTEDIELAREWACAKNHDGYVNIYEFDMSGLNVLNLNDTKYNILNWLAILADNRTYWQNGTIAEEAKEYAKKEYRVRKRAGAMYHELYIIDIMREGMENGDARLSR